MNLCKAAFTLLLLAVSAFADDRADRAKLIGVWESPGNGGKNGVWTISAGVDTLHITYMEGGQKLADFECNTAGRDCKAKAFGHDSTISMYFNGPKLVQMETRGAEVLKRMFSDGGRRQHADGVGPDRSGRQAGNPAVQARAVGCSK